MKEYQKLKVLKEGNKKIIILYGTTYELIEDEPVEKTTESELKNNKTNVIKKGRK